MPWMEANGASLRYELGGMGASTVVLMHEALGCLESFEDAARLLEPHYRVLSYDQRGFGFSEKVKRLDLETVVADLAALLDGLGIQEPVYLAGCAMGADFAAAFAARHPQRVARLVLTSPGIGLPLNPARGLERAARAEREGVRATMETSLEINYPEVLRIADRQRFRRYQSRWVCNVPASMLALSTLMAETDPSHDYPKLRAATLVIGGRHDTLRPPEMAEQVAKAIPGALYRTAETGHFMNVATPELFAQTLREFFGAA